MNLTPADDFSARHIGISPKETSEMLRVIGADTLDQLISETIPDSIKMEMDPGLPEAISEQQYLEELEELSKKNKLANNFIGQGYYGTITPSVILRNIFHNPGWYTQYTPYQAEISQGRLEAMLNFQTVMADLTGLPIANASLLDEGTAAAEAMSMFFQQKNKRRKEDLSKKFFVDHNVFGQTIEVLKGRSNPLEIELIMGDWRTFDFDDEYFGILIQYPDAEGKIEDFSEFAEKCRKREIYLCVAADILSLTLLKPPGEWGADVVVGNSQRFGVPMGYGGPHAAFFTTREEFKRQIPGRIIGVSVDALGDMALRMALQTREQHIRREKATSNICTAQALLAIMAGMYAVYHGPEGLQRIAMRIHQLTGHLYDILQNLDFEIQHSHFFDTLCISLNNEMMGKLRALSEDAGINLFFRDDNRVILSLDETKSENDVQMLGGLFAKLKGKDFEYRGFSSIGPYLPTELKRTSEFLEHPIFKRYRTETSMMRYIKSLENKDLSLMHSMIPLGSCTMKLNAATELIPVSWPEFSKLHPFAPLEQCLGYQQLFDELRDYLCKVTGFAACSLQPNSGAQGELTGLMVIRAYHEHRSDLKRKVALIPSSAHGTNPASAVMAGLEVVVVKCDDQGNIDVENLKEKAAKHREDLAALMVTYPSTHGVFEQDIVNICRIVHNHGGLVYMDGANMNAQVGLTTPAMIGADVCHLNLHKTFAIPHGGGGPGMGPICVNDKLVKFLPRHHYANTGGTKGIAAVASAPWGSASILLISYGYLRLLGNRGTKKASEIAILNANYIKSRIEKYFNVLYVGKSGRVAHELIVDLRGFKEFEISAEDFAKRLIDYGFHAPTLSFPVNGTIMIEPTESENKEELDRFCEAMIAIRNEIDEIRNGKFPVDSNVLTNAPHSLKMLTADGWPYAYSREKAGFPLAQLKESHKFWSPVARVDNAYGDRNLVCTCPPMEVYESGIQ